MRHNARLPLTQYPDMIRIILLSIVTLCLIACEKAPPKTDDSLTPNSTQTQPPTPQPRIKPATYIGSEQCQLCHVTEQQDWLHSDHHKAMMEMDEKNVAGDFSANPLVHHGQKTRFSHSDNTYRVSTDEGFPEAATLDLRYTFGFFPLQQYLTALPGGRWQSLPFAWDARKKQEGGQQWFHLYKTENITPGDVLHWRSPSHNANYMCIECHATDFIKNYDPLTHSYQSTWKEIGVGCESCHGPGSRHTEWARDTNKSQYLNKGWDTLLTSGSISFWQHQSATMPKRTEPGNNTQVEQCAQCHSRRSRIHSSNHEKSLLDAFLPALLDEGLYHSDGQINDEVYEYGSFLQSRMAGKGVTCSNCHNPHSGKPKEEGNNLCLQCHNSSYDNPKHTLHPASSKGSFCVDCHMPAKIYMQVDARRDHSLRIPRPDLTEKIGTPNACNQCHTAQTASWASQKLDSQFGKQWRKNHYGETLERARLSQPSSYRDLIALINNVDQPSIVRATAITLLPNFPSRDYRPILQNLLGNAEPLIRLGAIKACESLPPEDRIIAIPLLEDSQRALRTETARLLAGNLAVTSSDTFKSARQEFITGEMLNADRASALTNLANLAIQEQRMNEAQGLLQQAILLEPYYIPASINLADLYRMLGQEEAAGKILKTALSGAKDNAELNLAFALWLVRNSQLDSAIKHLKIASERGKNPHFNYVYAIALQQNGKVTEALDELDHAAAMPQYSDEIQIARFDLAQQNKFSERAKKALTDWEKLDPENPAILARRQMMK